MDKCEMTELKQYLTFTLDEELFAVNIAHIREVLDLTIITRVPRTPEFLGGVINLRGSVIPVVDMRSKFNMPKAERTVNTSIIIMEITLDEETTIIGALVDSVQEVINLEQDHIEPPPRFGTRLSTESIKGMGKHGDIFIIILDINNVFSIDEFTLMQDAGSKESAGQTSKKEGDVVCRV